MVLEDVLHAHPISEQRMKEVLGHTPLQARSAPGPAACMHARTLHVPAAPLDAHWHTSQYSYCLQRHTAYCLLIAHGRTQAAVSHAYMDASGIT